MKEAERVAKTYKEFFATTVLLLAQLASWRQDTAPDTMRKFKVLGKKVERINKRYTDEGIK